MLDRLLAQLQQLRAQLEQGDDAARTAFRQQSLLDNRDSMGTEVLADRTARNAISVQLPEDRPGSRRELLHVFERHGVSLASIHSSRTPAGEVHFRVGFVAGSDALALQAAAIEIDASGIGRVLVR